MRNISIILLLFFFSTSVKAQSKSDFNLAVATANEAIALFKHGQIKTADSMIRESIRLYPTREVFDYATELGKSPDITGSNLVMNALFDRVKVFDKSSIYFKEVGFMNKETIIDIPLYLARFKFAVEILNVNKAFAGYQLVDRSMVLVLDQPIPEKKLLDRVRYFTVKLELALHRGKYDEALSINDEMKREKLSSGNGHKIIKSSILTEKGQYEDALTLIKGEKSGEFLMFMNYALLGENEMAIQNFEIHRKNISLLGFFGGNLTKISLREEYYLALIDINRKFYSAALEKLSRCIIERANTGMDVYRQEPLWKVYKLIGDAYTGLQQYEKAKDNYTISLLSYPEYDPAKRALSSLNSIVAKTLTIDKTPPIISISEPSVKRGLKVVSSKNDILIKGLAADPSGLKSVTINGQDIYAQTDGNFWGNVILKEGNNKIILRATDGAGNVGEQIFEIEKSSAVTANKIIPVTFKESKSYCLLIGAQDYEDTRIPSLANPIQDAVRLKIILKKDYGFEDNTIITLFNPSANEVKRQLLELTNTILPEDNLLIFYAGHGIWVEKEKKGYWLLTDAKRDDASTWLQNKDVLNLIAKLPSRNTLLITDACFSGGVFKTRSIGNDAPANIKTMNEKISRVAITSGNDTEVPDESVFMKYLVKALSENKEKYLTAQKMFINQIMEAVMTESKTEPRYGTLELAGHVGGDFIFTKK